MLQESTQLLSGNEAVALAALHAGVTLGTGYPGTPSTEILENFAHLGGKAQWAPNEKVAYEVGLGVAFGGARALVTMKHVGVNVAADPMFTSAYTGVRGGFVFVSADDPGMASSQNEQDNRRYARAAGVLMLEPSDAQEAYDFTLRAYEISEAWRLPVMLRMTTRVCHSKSVVRPGGVAIKPAAPPHFIREMSALVMVPAFARPAHRRLREKLARAAEWNDQSDLNRKIMKSPDLGIIASGVSYLHAREAAPNASILKLGMTYPLPLQTIRKFIESVKRCVVIEEGDPYLVEALRYEGWAVEGKPEMYRFGELTVPRVRRILSGDVSPEPIPPRGKPPQLCQGCPHRMTFAVMKKYDCIVSGDIGCYTLSVLPPFETMDSCVCMGASITVGLGLRHALPPEEARKVVSVIGDSTFVHSGLTGIAEMIYNPPETGHVVVILDNGTTAMTGMQEHPGTGRTLDHQPTNKLSFERVLEAMGVPHVTVTENPPDFEAALKAALDRTELSVIIMRRTCRLAEPKIQLYEKAAERCNQPQQVTQE